MTEWIYDPQAGRCRKTVGGQAMTRRRKKTDGERIVDGLFRALYGYGPYENQRLSIRVNRLIRRRMAEAWDDGWLRSWEGKITRNPYRVRVKK